MKLTLVKSLLLILFLAVIGSGCLKQTNYQTTKPPVDEGDNRPRLSIERITTSNFGLLREAPTFPLVAAFDLRLRNDGILPALVDKIDAMIESRSGDCDLSLEGNKLSDLGRAIRPGDVEKFYVGARVQSPCKGSLSLKITVEYANLETKVKYTQDFTASTPLAFPLSSPTPAQ
jgi:hypothetical protein